MSAQYSFQEANQLFRNKDFEAAATAYRSLKCLYPELAHIADFNLRLIAEHTSAKLSLTARVPQLPAQEPKLEMPLQQTRAPQSGPHIDEIYSEIDRQLTSSPDLIRIQEGPMVSIIVTSHNTERYIENCLESLAQQSYRNKEIIVVDDMSSDDTVEIIRRFSKSAFPVRLLQLNSNLGTYYAKNYGITRSKGEVIFFQDSDDVSHHHRISLQMTKLLSGNFSVVRGAYARVNTETEHIIKVNSLISKLGLITLGVKKDVFHKLGYFNCTTKASDDEFFNRIIKYLGREHIVDLTIPTYFNTMRENSLFSDMVSWNSDGSIKQQPSQVRAEYVQTFKATHQKYKAAEIRRIFSFPRVRDAIPVASEMSKLANPAVKVVMNLCSIPSRVNTLEKTIKSILPQADAVNVYLDRYEEIPSFLESHSEKIKIVRSQERGGLRDNGKFIALEEIKQTDEDVYYFTVDDDIVYPPDYVNTLIKRLNEYDNMAVVGVHGVLLKDRPAGYFSDLRRVYGFEKALERDKLVNVLGTGTVAFHTSLFPLFKLKDFEMGGMVDLYFAALCKSRRIPLISVQRPAGWLFELKAETSETLYNEFLNRDEPQGELIRKLAPWGVTDILNTIDHIDKESIKNQLRKLVPEIRFHFKGSLPIGS